MMCPKLKQKRWIDHLRWGLDHPGGEVPVHGLCHRAGDGETEAGPRLHLLPDAVGRVETPSLGALEKGLEEAQGRDGG